MPGVYEYECSIGSHAQLGMIGDIVVLDSSCAVGFDCLGVCGGSAVEDCLGVCNGSAQEDCLGVCNGCLLYTSDAADE